MHAVTLRQKTPLTESAPSGRTSRTSRIAAWKERGATMVEFAIVAVWLFALIFLIIEGAFAVRARSTMANAIDDAARRGAVAASADDADYQILFQLFGRGANSVADIEHVAIFRATNGNADVPVTCKSGTPQGGASACNVYTNAQLFDANGAFKLTRDQFGCPAGFGTSWCSNSRGNDPNNLEFVGVYVQANYRFILQGVFTENFTVNVNGQALQAIETSGEVGT